LKHARLHYILNYVKHYMPKYNHIFTPHIWEACVTYSSCIYIGVRFYEVMSGNCGSGKEYISRSYRRVRYRLVGYGSSALNIIQKERNT